MAALPPPVGWKLMPLARPNGPTGSTASRLGDRVTARHGELIKTTIRQRATDYLRAFSQELEDAA
jgi:hypothetical protein